MYVTNIILNLYIFTIIAKRQFTGEIFAGQREQYRDEKNYDKPVPVRRPTQQVRKTITRL